MKQIIKGITAFIIGTILVMILILVYPLVGQNGATKYSNINEHFKYGSIGSEIANGVPYWIWKVLPVIFKDKLPGEGYQSLGFLYEPGQDLPIGFSKRRVGVDRVGLNCAVCHTGTVRDNPDSKPRIITTMPANNLYLEKYIRFISAVGMDERFNAREMMPYIEQMGAKLNPLEKLVYRYIAIPQTRDVLITQGKRLAFLQNQPDWGPGRVDTFSPYKALQFNFPMDKIEQSELIGMADYPPIWQQKLREGLQLHWDGNNNSVDERNLSAALGAGVTPTSIDFPGMKRVADWLWELPAPAYPYPVNQELAATGAKIFDNNCASCHAFGADKVGKVTPIEQIGTDRQRFDSYTYSFLSNQNTLYADVSFEGKDQRFSHFRKTDGYANMPLDGVWLRAPYLHNGSVPTLTDLLEKPEQRPQVFYRGNDVFDQENVGFVSNIAQEKGKSYFKFDTTLPGNGNQGHLYGTDLASEDKKALIEYLKQL